MLRAIALSLALCAVLAAPAAGQVQDAGGRLVYVFSLDALDGDRVDAGQAPFLGRLLLGQEGNRATYYRESRSIMVAETNPNHVAMATGAFGDRSGIPGNAFAVYGERARQDCAADADGSTDGEVATCLVAETFFAAAKRQARERVTTAGVFGKPKLADIFATKRVDPAAYDADFLWSPCVPSSPTPYCDPSAPARPNDGYAVVDDEVMNVVLRTVREGVPAEGGARKRPNLTFVNLPTIDSVGHFLGTSSGAYDTAIAEADRQLARFVAAQKEAGLWKRTVMFVVSDHSMDTTLGKTSLQARYAAAGIGDGALVSQNGSVDMVYLADRADPGRFAKLEALRAEALKSPGVDEALYREPNPADGGVTHTLDVVHPGWRIAGDRTGDLLVTHKAEGAFSEPVNPLVGNHGSPYTTDNMFAIAGGGADVRQGSVGGTVGPRFDDTLLNPGSAQNVDVAPTALALLGLEPPAQSEGRVLAEAFVPGAFSTAGAGTPSSVPPRAGGCLVPRSFTALAVRPRGRRGLRFAFRLARGARAARVEVFRLGGPRLTARRVVRFTKRAAFTWGGGRGGDGLYVVRLRSGADTRRVVLRRRGGRFAVRPASERRGSCGLLQAFRLAPAFGGRARRALAVSFTLGATGRVFTEVLRGRRVVRRYPPATRRAGAHVLRIPAGVAGRGDVRVRVTVTARAERVVATLTSRRV